MMIAYELMILILVSILTAALEWSEIAFTNARGSRVLLRIVLAPIATTGTHGMWIKRNGFGSLEREGRMFCQNESLDKNTRT